MLEHVGTGTNLYFLHMLQDNGMGIQFKWKEIKDISVAIFGDRIFDDIVKNEIVETCSDNEMLEVTNLNNIDSNLPRSQREALYSAIIKFLSTDENVPGIMEIIYASRKIGRAIMDSINMNIIINKLEDRYINLRIAMAIASSMDFYYSLPFRSFCKTRMDKIQFSIDNYEKYLGDVWFIKIVLAMKDNTGESLAYGKSQENSRLNYIETISGLAASGLLASLFLHSAEFLNDTRVNSAINRYEYNEIKKQRAGKFYGWVAIGNDVAIGLEFLSGSILFLSQVDYFYGVYLFIAASIQLLVKPGIEIFRRARVSRMKKNK